jgi:hypothetical protein
MRIDQLQQPPPQQEPAASSVASVAPRSSMVGRPAASVNTGGVEVLVVSLMMFS